MASSSLTSLSLRLATVGPSLLLVHIQVIEEPFESYSLSAPIGGRLDVRRTLARASR